MTEPLQRQLDALDQEIAALTARKQALLTTAPAPWPTRVTLYAYCSKESNWDTGETLGLEGEALSRFVHFEEVRLDVEVAEDGMVTVLACDGKAVQR